MTSKSVTWTRDEDRAFNLGGGLFVEDGVLRVWVEDDHYNGAVARADLPALLALVLEALGDGEKPG